MSTNTTDAERKPLDTDSRIPTRSRADLPSRKAGAQPGNKHAVRLSPKVRAVAALLLTEPDLSVEAACERAQCPRSTFYKAERSEGYQQYLASLSRTRIRTRLLTRAMHRIERAQDAKSEYVALQANEGIARQAGVYTTDERGQRPGATGGVTIRFVSTAAQNGATAVQVDVHPTKEDAQSDG
jgi:hypothetical protein